MTFASDLRKGRTRLGVWGLGYIGFTTAATYASRGIEVLGYDPLPERVEATNRGIPTLPNLRGWLGFDTEYLAQGGKLKATKTPGLLLERDAAVHFVAVPTEKSGKPWSGPLEEVTEDLMAFLRFSEGERPLVIVESTLNLPMAEKLDDALDGFHWAVANRRDWFGDPAHNLRTIPRIVGGNSDTATHQAELVCKLVTDTVLRASSWREAVLVKALENSLRHVDIAVVNELARAYPDVDIREVARLAGTKWNIETYAPSIGQGGYCLPVSGKYLTEGASIPGGLRILEDSYQSNLDQPSWAAQAFITRGCKRVGILGLAYKADIPVAVLSPSIQVAWHLQKAGIEVGVHDPYIAPLAANVDAVPFRFPEDLGTFDGLLLAAPHRAYMRLSDRELSEALRGVKFVLDNEGAWSHRTLPGVEIKCPGQSGWLG